MQANSSTYVSLKQLKLHNKLIYASKVFDNFVCHLLILHETVRLREGQIRLVT